jgi:transketolase
VESAEELARGAYVLSDVGEGPPEMILMASGSEVSLVYVAAVQLAKEGLNVRVVSFPSWELFEEQDEFYRETVLPERITKRVAVEAGAGLGWERYVGSKGTVISLDHFGASAPGKILFEKFGFTVENVIAKVRENLL